ncbi:MAG: efflux RND transporter periplasmic adaptor subunit, partial [Gammaproteobacteria bacterium]
VKIILHTLLMTLSVAVAAEQPPLHCVIEPDRVAEVGSPVIGVVEQIFFERGDAVRKGQVLVQLSSNVERASVSAAKARAEMEADVKAAAANDELQRLKLARTEELIKKKFVPQQVLEQVRAETSVAEQKLVQAREQRRVAKQELALAQAQLGLRSIRAPFTGVIADRYVNVGERVELQPLFRVVGIDSLRVEIIAPASLFGAVTRGMAVRVTPDLPNAVGIQGRVVLVDRLVDAASNTFRVRAEIPNGESTTSGLRCGAELPALNTETAEPADSLAIVDTSMRRPPGDLNVAPARVAPRVR